MSKEKRDLKRQAWFLVRWNLLRRA